ALSQQNGNDGKVAVLIGVHKMGHHVVTFAVDLFLARMVEVKLFQLVLLVTNADKAARGVVDLDGMAVVDDMERRRFVVELNRGQISFLRLADIDWRLVLPKLAGGV